MDCLSPIRLKTGEVPCGKCTACLQRRTSDWTVRLQQEYSTCESCWFITLTYTEISVPRETIDGKNIKVLCKRDVQLFLKRLRKAITPYKVRFFACGEYGPSTFRPHYHMLLFNFPNDKFDAYKTIVNKWSHGFITLSKVIPAHFSYIAKYCASYMDLPNYLRDKAYRPFVLCSRHPAIGFSYLSEDIKHYHRTTLSTLLVSRDGIKRSLPRYYRNHIFDDDMKLQIAERSQAYRNEQALLDQAHELSVKHKSDTEPYIPIRDQRKIRAAYNARKLFKTKRKI